MLAPIPRAARAVLDINDRGPVLEAGDFYLRVTNAGIIGNAFFNQGLSFDPSFEYPKGSGQEVLGHAELWVGAVTPEGSVHVSGGPMLEWRPTLDPDDRVRKAWTGDPKFRRRFDEDHDDRVDEEILNGRDDDGDGRIDEDMGIVCDEMMAADYTDDEPAAVNYTYPNGEPHQPLHLSVHQEAYSWAAHGYDGIAGLRFTVTNHGGSVLTGIYLGLYCDLDSRMRIDPTGHLNDIAVLRRYSLVIPQPTADVATCHKPCVERYEGTIPVVTDGGVRSGMPAVAVVPLTHTTDPIALLRDYPLPGIREAREAARAPGKDTTFRVVMFARDLPAGQGGEPVVDIERYRAMQGDFPTCTQWNTQHDWSALVSCGPFPQLEPGASLTFEVAIVAAPNLGSIDAAMANARFLQRGFRRNLQPDAGSSWRRGDTYVNGHEICLEAPAGKVFQYYPHCVETFVQDRACGPIDGLPPSYEERDSAVTYQHGRCVWTNLDCDLCTGIGGAETWYEWLDPGSVPPPPWKRVVEGDHEMRIEWDDWPEIILNAGFAGDSGYAFVGYRLYRLSNWTRRSELPPPAQWDLIGCFRNDSLDQATPLARITDPTVPIVDFSYSQKHHGIGRYRTVDRTAKNGFDYLYAITTVIERPPPPGGLPIRDVLETPIIATLDSVVTPHFEARDRAGEVWVVPNPYRVHAPWDRPAVPGDPFRRHLDFCGLPRALCTIRIYTVAGDLVASIVHDASAGNGQASWDLISRNGQDVESGIYLFTVSSSLGHSIGRFVVIR